MASLHDALLSFIDYDAWATHRLLDAATPLSSDDLAAPAGAPERSIRQLLVHQAATRAFWQAMLLGGPRPDASPAGPTGVDGVDAIRAWSDGVRADYRRWVAGLVDADLDRVFTTRMGGRSWLEMLLQVEQHAIHHRGEVSALLTERGHSPGDLDYLFYLRDRDAAPA